MRSVQRRAMPVISTVDVVKAPGALRPRRRVQVHGALASICLALAGVIACGDEVGGSGAAAPPGTLHDGGGAGETDSGSQGTSDAAVLEAAPPQPEPDAIPVTGKWFFKVIVGPTQRLYYLDLNGGPTAGTFVVFRDVRDGFGKLFNCRTLDKIEGAWRIEGQRLWIEPTSGTTERIVDSTAPKPECAVDNRYRERPMTAAEVDALNIFSGEFVTRLNDQTEYLEVRPSGSTLWAWNRSP